MNVLWNDLRYACRLLGRQPGFTTVVVLSPALGIGVNSLIFSVVQAVLLRPLAYRDPGRLVMVWFTSPRRPNQNLGSSVANYLALQERNRVFDEIGAFQEGYVTNLSAGAGEALGRRPPILTVELLTQSLHSPNSPVTREP